MGLSKSKQLGKEDLYFLRTHTNFTVQELQQWHKDFFQECPDGKMTKKKFVEVHELLIPSAGSSDFCDHVFRSFDQDHSGYIDFKEFMLALHVTSSGAPEQKLRWAFKLYDIDDSKTIELEEIVKIIQAIYDMLHAQNQEPARVRATKLMDRMDENKDGKLTEEEFLHGCMIDEGLRKLLSLSKTDVHKQPT